MRANKSKSFPFQENDSFQNQSYSNGTSIKKGQEEFDYAVITIGEIARRLFLILQKLFGKIKSNI